MMKEGLAFMHESTFLKYANKLFGTQEKIKKGKQKPGKRTNKPFELLHMDATVVKFQDGTKAFVHLIIDNFSRAILGWKIARTCSSFLAVQNLKEVCEKHNLYYKQFQLLCDNGSENEGEVNIFLLRPDIEIEKQIAQVDVIYSNSMIEAVNKRLKYYYLFPMQLKNYQHLEKYLPVAIENENNRESGVLYGYTPTQVLTDAVPDKNRFAQQIKQAKQKRKINNRKTKCQSC